MHYLAQLYNVLPVPSKDIVDNVLHDLLDNVAASDPYD